MRASRKTGRWFRNTLIAAFLGLALATPGRAQHGGPAAGSPMGDAGTTAETPNDIAGVYLCKGANAEGEPYSALVTITPYGEAYRMQWVFRSGEAGAIGMAIRDGDALAVMFVSRIAGVAMYRRQGDDGVLVGRWTLANAEGAVFTETLTRIAGVVPEESDEPGAQAAPRRSPRRVDSRSRRAGSVTPDVRSFTP